MTREEITNSQDYKATDVDADPDIVDAYSEGVIYGWNNPQWIPVEERKPNDGQVVFIYTKHGSVSSVKYKDGAFNLNEVLEAINVTHWMPIVPPQGKEE